MRATRAPASQHGTIRLDPPIVQARECAGLVMIGDVEPRRQFAEAFEAAGTAPGESWWTRRARPHRRQ